MILTTVLMYSIGNIRAMRMKTDFEKKKIKNLLLRS